MALRVLQCVYCSQAHSDVESEMIHCAALGPITLLQLPCITRGGRTKQRPSFPPHFSRFHSGFYAQTETSHVDGNTLNVCVCLSHLNEGSVPDLAVQCFDVWGQVHVQQEVILEETTIHTPHHQNTLPGHDIIASVQCHTADF